MENEHIIKITDISRDAQGENAVEITTRGCYYGTPDDYRVEYDEVFGDGMTGHTVVIVRDRQSVSILRTGSIISELTIEQGKRHNCVYRTPFGDLNLGIYASGVKSRVGPDGGTLQMKYTVDIDGSLTSEKQLLIHISKITQ